MNYQLSDELKEILSSYFAEEIEAQIENFSNGRFVRNLYEDLIMNQAVRIDKISHPTSGELTLLTSDDFKQL